MFISFGECSVPVSGFYLYLASPSWSNLLAIADAPPMLVVACAPPLRFIAYVSLAFSLGHFCFFRTCGERPRRIRPLGGKNTLCFICADPCRTRFLYRCGRPVVFCAAELIDVRRHHGRLFVRRASVRRQGDQAL